MLAWTTFTGTCVGTLDGPVSVRILQLTATLIDQFTGGGSKLPDPRGERTIIDANFKAEGAGVRCYAYLLGVHLAARGVIECSESCR